MGRCRFVPPETVRLSLSEGEWIDVKKQLTAGEQLAAHAAIIKEVREDGKVLPNYEMVRKAQVLAYLVDWSLVDLQGKHADISTDGKKLAAVNGVDPETFNEISTAIDAHVAGLKEASKNDLSGESAPSAISSSAA